MNDHSELWHERKSALSTKEKTVKGELEEVSSHFEKKVKYVLIVALISGVVFLLVNSFFRKKKSKLKNQKNKTVSAPTKRATIPGLGIKSILVEKLLFAFVGYAITQIKEILAGSIAKKEEDKLKDS